MVVFVHMCFLMEPESRKPKTEHITHPHTHTLWQNQEWVSLIKGIQVQLVDHGDAYQIGPKTKVWIVMETYMVAFVHMCFLMEPENRKPKPEHCVFHKKSRMSWCKLTKSSFKCLYGGFRAHVLFNGTRKPNTYTAKSVLSARICQDCCMVFQRYRCGL